jgi:hypothetical protein
LLVAAKTGLSPATHLAGLPASATYNKTVLEQLMCVPACAQALDSRERAFLQKALQHDWQQRPTAAELLASDVYIKMGLNARWLQSSTTGATAGTGLLFTTC